MTIKLEADPGSEITDAFQEAIELSNRIQFSVEFNFNGVTCFVKPGGNVKKGIDEYGDAISSGKQHKFARSY